MNVHQHPSAIVGRDGELEAIRRWLERARPSLLEVDGEAGIGKTTLLEEGTRSAREAGMVVLACRPVEVETAVSYGALATLIEPVLAAIDDAVPAPRLRALEGALRLRDVSSSRLDETAVALGALSVLRSIAHRQPVVLALDDVQWLDASSRVALTYTLRNLRPGDDIAVLLACRLASGDGPLALAGSALAATTERLQLGPLSLGALHSIVNERLGAPLSRPKLVRVHSASGGNPLHAIELGRVVADVGPQEAALAAPASLPEVLRARIKALSAPTQRLLLVVAAAGDPSVELAARAMGTSTTEAEFDEAIRQGVLVFVGRGVRFSHPLLASTVYADMSELERSRVHSTLAELAETAEERARHFALAVTGPDQTVAEALEDAAESSCRRGARSAGASLFEQAASLTPADDESTRARRLVAAAHAHFEAGESDRARALLEAVAADDGPIRFEALCRLGRLLDETIGGDASLAVFEEALHTDDPALEAWAHRCLAQTLAYVGNIEQALAHADAAVVAAEPLDDRVILVYSLSMQAFVRKIAGHAEWREPLDRALALESEVELPELDACPSAVEADSRRLLLELDEARTAYQRMLARATHRDDVPTETWCRFGLASIEIASGRWGTAAEHEAELSDLAEQTGLLRLPALRTAAHLAALRGDVTSARALLGTVVDEAEPKGELHNLRAALQLEGLLELSLGDPGSALAPLRRARKIAGKMAIGEPSMLMFLLDEVEALAGTGDPEGAGSVLRAFEERCDRNRSAWITPLVLRARGLVLAAGGSLDEARSALEAAVAAEGALLHLFDAPSTEALEAAGRHAGLRFERIVQAVSESAERKEKGT
jgi:tetratricopeptide (TPR) repeat protein